MTHAIKILMILTSQATRGADPRPTGVWFEEVSTPYYAFIDAGAHVDIASITGGQIPVDPHSQQAEGKNPASVERFLKDPAAMAKLQSSLKIDHVSADGYTAIFLPGGHGTMWDLPQSTTLASLLSSAWAKGKVVSAVCHGPAGLINVRDINGQPLVAGRRVSAFTNTEEDAAGLSATVPFLLETRLRQLGAHYERGDDFQPFAVRDGKLVSGQNPASSEEVARLVLQAAAE
ncbi:type 1 glutamine amidotransferase domain-containing protein [Dyella telluris]|uniref:Type 1 glutamine amidotransferase domain-containing protein n=1 Tax=Dyella telluris TaxID=2763498 RepID=A0A7G8Q3I8_9GAMM|nr:type 1 glutamine amidotransferase domain-containing protein [Dyella telluris]QNK01346.1 type 1 glutamine amidotransferase domain-containing protein [Dyella telluris]